MLRKLLKVFTAGETLVLVKQQCGVAAHYYSPARTARGCLAFGSFSQLRAHLDFAYLQFRTVTLCQCNAIPTLPAAVTATNLRPDLLSFDVGL